MKVCCVIVCVAAGMLMPAVSQTKPDTLFPCMNGFKLEIGPQIYTSDNLFELIDGAADLFLTYDFIDLRTAEYSCPGIEYIRIEAYRHASPANAFGMYAQERPPETKFLPIGGQGYQEEGALNFWYGRYYIRMSTNAKEDSVQNAMRLIAQRISESAKQETSLPACYSLFPEKAKKQNSEMYVNQDFLGYKFFSSAYIVSYEEWKLFVMDFADSLAEQSALKNYCDVVKAPAEKNAQGFLSIHDPHMGTIILKEYGKKLAGVYEFTDGKKSMESLGLLVQALEHYR